MIRCVAGIILLWSIAIPGFADERKAPAYDPLRIAAAEKIVPVDMTVHDAARDRDIPIRVFRSAEIKSAPVILFSHGLGGSREMGAYLGQHWAARGYVAVFLQHPGSDTSVWKGLRPGQIMAEMKKAASAENFMLRAKDVPAVLDQLEVWNREQSHPLHGTLDVQRVGMSGHSFGAVTTQAVSGQGVRGEALLTDPRIKAALPMSPGTPAIGDPKAAFRTVQIPWLLMTGTLDVSKIGGQTVESRRAVYPALPPGGKYEIVLDKGEHSAFTDRALPGDREQRNPNHHRVILALSTAFWDAYLKEDQQAKAWLDGDGPQSVLEAGDAWQKK